MLHNYSCCASLWLLTHIKRRGWWSVARPV